MIHAFLGIDPGVSGAAALIFEGGFSLHDFSTPKRASEVVRMWDIEYSIRFAVLEMVKIYPAAKKERCPMTGQKSYRYRSYKTINKLPKLAGVWVGILCAVGIDFQEVLPRRWQKILPPIAGVGTKGRSLIAAREFFPDACEYLKFKKNHDRADALNLAKYAQILSG